MTRFESLFIGSYLLSESITTHFSQDSDEAEAIYLLNPVSHVHLKNPDVWTEVDIATLYKEWSEYATEIWERGGVPAPPPDEWLKELQKKEE
jgi:hypothetical protein